MNKQIQIRFEPESNAEFVGEEFVANYEQCVKSKPFTLIPLSSLLTTAQWERKSTRMVSSIRKNRKSRTLYMKF